MPLFLCEKEEDMANNTINYQVNFSTNLDNLQTQLKKFATDLGKINPGSTGKLNGVIANLDKSFSSLREKMSKPITSQGQYSAIEREIQNITNGFGALSREYTNLTSMTRSQKLKLLPDDYSKQLASATEALAAFEKERARIDKKSADTSDKSKQLASLKKKQGKYEGEVSTIESKRTGQAASREKELDAINRQIAALEKLKETREAYDKIEASGTKVDRRKNITGEDGYEYSLTGARAVVKRAFGNTDMTKKDLSELQAEISRLQSAKGEAEEKVAAPFTKKEEAELEGYRQIVRDTTAQIDSLTKSIEQDEAAMESQKTDETNAAFTNLYNTLQGLGVNLDGIDPKLGYTKEGFEALRQRVEGLTDSQLAELNSKLSQTGETAQQTGNEVRQLGNETGRVEKEIAALDEQMSDVSMLTSRLQMYIGIQGAINLASRAMRRALSTIKELDKTMTEMAVVTDENIGGYWDELPSYTRRANELGVSINSVYQSDMLLYQQGLKTNQVVEISTEALKMARIAGLDAEEATNRLTSAIRGFGMELDQASAQRVSDVYSELAA